jgi:hypothetical protein
LLWFSALFSTTALWVRCWSLPLQERECEHLRQIIKELSQSRSKAHKTKVELEEQFAGLQKEYYRCGTPYVCV